MKAANMKQPPSLNELTSRFMGRAVDAAAIQVELDAVGEVEPHEVAVGYRIDPRLAWNEGLAVLAADSAKELKPPADWANMVSRQDAIAAQPMALACYPQRVRDLTALLQADDLKQLLPAGGAGQVSALLASWAQKQNASSDPVLALVAAAVLRVAGDFDQADAILAAIDSLTPSLQTVRDNEKAALLWQKGDASGARALWNSLPETPAVLFNRGMAELFLGNAARARSLLKKAMEQIPDHDGWHHLAALYLALAEMRGV